MKIKACESQKHTSSEGEFMGARSDSEGGRLKDTSMELVQLVSKLQPCSSPPTETKGRRQSLRSGFNHRSKQPPKAPLIDNDAQVKDEKPIANAKDTHTRKQIHCQKESALSISNESSSLSPVKDSIIEDLDKTYEMSIDSNSDTGSSKLFSFGDLDTEETEVKALVDDATNLEYQTDENTGSISSLSEPEYSFSDSSDDEDDRVMKLTRAFMGNMTCSAPDGKELGNLTCNLQSENRGEGSFECLRQQANRSNFERMIKAENHLRHPTENGEVISGKCVRKKSDNSFLITPGTSSSKSEDPSEESSLNDADKAWIESIDNSLELVNDEKMADVPIQKPKQFLRRSAPCKTWECVEAEVGERVTSEESDGEEISDYSLDETNIDAEGAYVGDKGAATILL